MSYVIFGRAIKNEHIVLGVVSTLAAGILATSGGKKDVPTTVQQVKESIPIKAGSSEEEQFIRKFIAEHEKEGASAGHH
ncbi:hypothetical protein D9758_005690 [Tetrapyrgos nigripes]|uniref:Uncharacterized protein n=1 Tax=Tetrapyrgos nigripes TaxID=182062 RepID=A0A8H5GJS4_9AGAR|nr:hypothetical protein D9758_005690 [Tetrapyrgos nigripes]